MNIQKLAVISIIVILLFAISSYGQINSKNTVAFYPFNGDAKDLSGNGKNGTVKGDVKWSPGKFGQAIELNGTNAWVEVPELGSFKDITIAEWVNATGRVGQWRVIYTDNGWSEGFVHHQLYTDNLIGFSIHSNTGGNDSKSKFVFDNSQLNKWHHLATVYSGTQGWLRFYIDGKLDVENKWGGNPAVLKAGRIGSWDGGGREWQGMFDDFIILNVALSEADIQNLINKGVSGVEPMNKLTTNWGCVKTGY